MRVMVLVKATRASEAGEMPSTTLLTEMGKYNEALVEAGILLAGEGLHPSSRGKRVRFSHDGGSLVVDGPFAESEALVSGYWLWRVESMEAAVDWVKRAPFDGGTEIELRPVLEADDFGEEFTPELRAQENRLQAEVDRRRKSHDSAS